MKMRFLTMLALAFLLGVGGAVTLNALRVPEPTALADECGVPAFCTNDPGVTSAIYVDHQLVSDSSTKVEPHGIETWTIGAEWWTSVGGDPSCTHIGALDDSIIVEVSFDGGVWGANCIGCDSTNGPFFQVSICGVECNEGDESHGYAYKLIVDIKDVRLGPSIGVVAFLTKVTYGLGPVPDGQVINLEHCTLDSNVTFVSSGGTNTDTGSFECAFNCDATGAYVALTYE